MQAGKHEESATGTHHIVFETCVVSSTLAFMHHKEVGGKRH